MESITWENSFAKDNDCWKLTNFCRDVISTPNMDEFGNGPTPETFATPKNHGMGIFLATSAGLLASVLLAYVMRGGFFKRRESSLGDVQFSSIRNQDIM